VPQDSLEFVILSAGGRCLRQSLGVAAPSEEELAQITHHVVDRSMSGQQRLTAAFVQPQWVYDSFNMRALLPVAPYAPVCLLSFSSFDFLSGMASFVCCVYTDEKIRASLQSLGNADNTYQTFFLTHTLATLLFFHLPMYWISLLLWIYSFASDFAGCCSAGSLVSVRR
jgi:hypothetical protein